MRPSNQWAAPASPCKVIFAVLTAHRSAGSVAGGQMSMETFCAAKHCLGGSGALFPQNKYQIKAGRFDWRHHALGDAGCKMRYGAEVYL